MTRILVKEEKKFGIVPVSWLCFKLSSVRSLILAMPFGIVPVRRLLPSFSCDNRVNSDIEFGMIPVN